ncbi:hypothetical protein FBU30_010275 [Linnemannia zychae]|nr:hypothetical protein FBU30_010275 [Linnemannia zychae]
MTDTVPTLKKESTSSLCDQYTNVFYDDLPTSVSSSIDFALSLPISLALSTSAKSQDISSSLDLASLSASSAAEYPSPAPSSEESDDSHLVDSLSPPSSPWFPSLSTSKTITAISNNAPTVGEEDAFFHNSFYHSLYDNAVTENGHFLSQPPLIQHRKISLPRAVKSVRDRSSASSDHQVSNHQTVRTAAPSDLFNVSLDQILSEGSLNLPLKSQQLLLSTIKDSLSSQEHSQTQQEVGSMLPQEESNMMEDTLTTGSLSAPEDSEDEDMEFKNESGHDNPSDSDDYESASVPKKKRTRVSAAASKAKTPRGAASSTTTKAPRARKGTYKRSLKVYPPRRPKSHVSTGDNGDVAGETVSLKNHGITLPGGIKLPLDKDGYLCEFCPKERFGRVHDLKRHQISKHNERTWPCDFCHRPFVRRDALLRHYAVKTARKDGVHPTAEDVDRLSEARARARLI